MANNEWHTNRKSDADVLAGFAELAKNIPSARLNIRVAESHQGSIDTALGGALNDTNVRTLLGLKEAAAYVLQLILDGGVDVSIVRRKDRVTDTVRLSFPEQHPVQKLIPLLASVRKQFPASETIESIERVLGPDVAKFYAAREAGLARLESVAQNLIERTEEYRRKLDTEHDEKEKQREVSWAARRDELEAAHNLKVQDVEARQKELDEYKASLDDRQSRHARRALQTQLQNALREHSKRFSLTSETTQKRRVIHSLFCAMVVSALAYVIATVVDAWGDSYDWVIALRVGLGIAGVVAIFLLYIRWADQWFRQHADEEFRLKRMGLDVDRASWVVETAMEWQHENKEPIPPHLIEQLSRDLFASGQRSTALRHPAEELGAALLSGASGMRINLPGGAGEISLDRRGVRDASKKFEAE